MRWSVVLLCLLSMACTVVVDAKAASTTTLSPVDPNLLIPMEGHIIKMGPTRGSIRESVRASLGSQARETAEVEFTYLGQSARVQPLTSGEVRIQIGLKLRAQDTCNLVYVMWRVAPTNGIYVGVKSNPGMNRNDQCHDGGYLPFKATTHLPIAPVREGEKHTLRAVLNGNELHVFTDGVETMSGQLPPQAMTFNGPVGIRTDNGNFDLEFRTR